MTRTSAGRIGVAAVATTALVGLLITIPHGVGAKTDDPNTPVAVSKQPAAKKPAAKADSNGNAAQVAHYFKRSAARAKIEETLQQKVQLDIIDLTLKDTVDQISSRHKIQILIDAQALADEGIMTDTLINVRLKDISLKSALRIILEPLGMEYLIKNEILVLMTATKAEEQLETRVYDTRHIKNVTSVRLIDVLQNTTGGPWYEIEGVGGTVSAMPGGLVIWQSQRVHEQVASVLEQLARLPAVSDADLQKYTAAEKDRRIKELEKRVRSLEQQVRQLKPKAKAIGGHGGGGFF